MPAFRSALRLIALCLALCSATRSDAATLELHLDHVRPSGTIVMTIFADASSWAAQQQPLARRVLRARDIAQIIRVDDLAPGRYAVRVEQAASIPESIDVLMRPRSGFSGNAGPSPLFMPPFERAAITLREGTRVLHVHMFQSNRY